MMPRSQQTGDGAPGAPSAGGEGGPEPLALLLARLAPPATLAAACISLLVHLIALMVAAVIVFRTPQAGGAGAIEAPVELAIVTESELAEMGDAAIGGEAPSAPEVPLPEETESVGLMDTSVGQVDLGLDETIDIDAAVGGGDIGGGDALGIGGLGSGGAGGGAASFFGAEARGTRFAYIVDVSGSMAYDGKIESLKRELGRSIDALVHTSHFFVCPFSSGAAPLESRREWAEATDAGKLRATRAINALTADGSTAPAPAFEIVFSLRPRPDAIYFMTDGQFDPSVAAEVVRLNVEHRVPIHCIAFVSKESEPLMKKIAEDSGGTYTFVPGPGGRK